MENYAFCATRLHLFYARKFLKTIKAIRNNL